MNYGYTAIAGAFVYAATAASGHATQVASDWPGDKTIRMIVPAPGGSGTGDNLARMIAEQLRKRTKAVIVVDNRTGANGAIGTVAAARATPDGTTLLFSWVGALVVSPILNPKSGYDAQGSFEPIALIADVPNVLVVNSKMPATMKEFVEYSKARPGSLNFGSTGIGSSMHLAGELFMRETGTKLLHIPYSGAGHGITNLASNEIQAMFQLVPGVVGPVKSNLVRPLAVMAATRSPALPNVPTTSELGFPKMLSSSWFALLAPKNTPEAIVQRVNMEINEVLKDPEVREKMAEMGASVLGGTTRDLQTHIKTESQKWEQVVRSANIQTQ